MDAYPIHTRTHIMAETAPTESWWVTDRFAEAYAAEQGRIRRSYYAGPSDMLYAPSVHPSRRKPSRRTI